MYKYFFNAKNVGIYISKTKFVFRFLPKLERLNLPNYIPFKFFEMSKYVFQNQHICFPVSSKPSRIESSKFQTFEDSAYMYL